VSENKTEPTNVAPHQKGAHQEPRISSDATELPDNELNKVTGGAPVTGGKGGPPVEYVQIVKKDLMIS
jgi:hypothetical protein